MRAFIVCALLILSGCGAYTVPESVGGLKSTNPLVIDESDKNQIKAICDAIAQKTIASSTLVGSQAVFDYSIKECTGKSLGAPLTVPTTIQSGPNGYSFTLPGGSNFYFADLETTDTGSLASICAELKKPEDLTSPIVTGNEYLYFTTSSVSTSECPVVQNQKCIYLQKGSLDIQGYASIHTKLWIRINLESKLGRLGYFTLKKELTSLGCAQQVNQIHQAILK